MPCIYITSYSWQFIILSLLGDVYCGEVTIHWKQKQKQCTTLYIIWCTKSFACPFSTISQNLRKSCPYISEAVPVHFPRSPLQTATSLYISITVMDCTKTTIFVTITVCSLLAFMDSAVLLLTKKQILKIPIKLFFTHNSRTNQDYDRSGLR